MITVEAAADAVWVHEMLEGGGNPWRGMIYGMTNRFPYCGDPRPLWRLWDSFGIAESEMLGYWSKECPVRTGREDVLATVCAGRDPIRTPRTGGRGSFRERHRARP